MKMQKTEPWQDVAAEAAGEATPPWVVVVAVILIGIPLALCCYLLLRL